MEQDLIQQRNSNLIKIKELGIDPYSFNIRPKICNADIYKKAILNIDDESWLNKMGPVLSCHGRIVLRRTMGNLHFLTIRDYSGTIQIAISKKEVSSSDWSLAQLLDLGDIVSAKGILGFTKTKEPTIWSSDINIISKCLIPTPSKTDGLKDIESRMRNRSMDLAFNQSSLNLVQKRSAIIKAIRQLLWSNNFQEVETPILHSIVGGASALPFETYHKALELPLYLRIAPELYLKKMIVGGMDSIFEIGKNFRNEGISTKHNPEFTALEVYSIFSKWEDMAQLAEQIVRSVYLIANKDIQQKPFTIVSMSDLVNNYCKNNNVELPKSVLEMHKIYEDKIEDNIIAPTFVTHLPASVVPLAKSYDNEHAEMFDLIIDGKEIGCGYTEQNDPQIQNEVFDAQIASKTEGYAEKDNDFINALKLGMPPTGGLGIGIDRLLMVALDVENIRELISFPILRKEEYKNE